MKRKQISVLLAMLVILALVTGACGAPAATSGTAATTGSTQLNLYGWSEYVPQALLDGFTAKTGIKVNYDAYSSNEELMAKLQACLLYTSPSPRDRTRSRMPSSA